MSEEKEEELKVSPSGGMSKPSTPSKPPPPKTIAAQSQSWNSAAKIVILGVALLGLLILTGIALFIRPEAMRDLLWAAVTLIAYLAGSGEFTRKEDK